MANAKQEISIKWHYLVIQDQDTSVKIHLPKLQLRFETQGTAVFFIIQSTTSRDRKIYSYEYTDILLDGVPFDSMEDLEEWLHKNTGSEGPMDVVIQSSTSPFLILKASELKLETTLTALAIEDGYTFEVASVVGAEIGHQLTMYSVVNNRISTFTVLNIIDEIIYIDSPIDYAYEIGDFAQFGNTNLAVDGSITPVIFGIRNPTAQDIELSVDFTRMILSMQTTTLGNLSLFGNIAKLEKGLVCRFVDGIKQNVFNVKDNRELDNLMFDFKFIPTQGGAPDGLSGRFTLEKLGAVARLRPFQDVQFIVQDNLAPGTPNITILEIILEGAGVVD